MGPRIEVDGRPAEAGDLWYPAQVNHGHFTVMQVRGRAVRGLDLHLARLDGATRELYGTGLDGDRVRAYVRRALADRADATVKVTVFRPATDTAVMVAVSPPAEPPREPQSLWPVEYWRPLAHIKHTGTFGQLHFRALAARDGHDDVLLIDRDGVVAEAGIANIGFHDGETVVWPDAPALPGTTMQLLDRALAEAGRAARRRTVRLADLPSFGATFVCNSRGVAPVGRVDDVSVPVDETVVAELIARYEAVPWDRI